MMGKSIRQIWVNLKWERIHSIAQVFVFHSISNKTIRIWVRSLIQGPLKFFRVQGERGGVVVEHRSPNREVVDLIPIGGTVLCP